GGLGARENSLSLDQVADLHQRSTQVGRNLSAGGLVVGQEDGGPSQEPDRRRRIAAGEGAPAGRGEQLCAAGCKRARVGVGGRKLGPVAVRLLEVVTEDLLVLSEPAWPCSFEPGGEALV